MKLDRQSHNSVIGLLANLFENPSDRKAIFLEVYGHDPHLKSMRQRIDFDGAARTFAVKLIHELDEYGVVDDGNQALWLLLEHIVNEKLVGLDQQEFILSLEEDVNSPTRAEVVQAIPTNEQITAVEETRAPAKESPELVRFVTHRPVHQQAREWISAMHSEHMQPLERWEWGNRLNEVGDPRRGVGLREDGIPDIDWVKIPGGHFIYGDISGLKEGEVPLSKHLQPFYIACYPITYQQFAVFIDAPDGYANDQWWAGLAVRQQQPGEQAFKIANRPRENVSWYDAMAYCRWLSDRLSYEVRLPTNIEWERAARGGDSRVYPWGDELQSTYANYGMSIAQTTAVGVFIPGASPYGVLDMLGNVWEWCLSLNYDPDDNDLSAVDERVLRGGAWHNSLLTTYVYRGGDADGRQPGVGFRVARSAPS